MIRLLVLVALLPFFASLAHAADAPPPVAPKGPAHVKGEVIMMTQEFLVIRDADGKGVQVLLDKGTTLDGAVKQGGIAEASLNSQGVATSVKAAK